MTIVLVVGVLGVGAVAARKIRSSIIAKNALAKGKAAFEKGDWEEASKELREFLSRKPDNPEILAQYAHALLRRRPFDGGSIAGAIDSYRRILRLEPGDEASYKQLARLYRATGNRDELIYVAERRLKELEGDPDATIWKAEALIMRRKFDDARGLLNELEERLAPHAAAEPRYSEVCALLASLELDEAGGIRAADAIRRLTAGIDNGPPSARLLIHRASLYRQRAQRAASGSTQQGKDNAAARVDLERAGAVPAGKPSNRLLLAAEWLAAPLKDTERASAQLDLADAIDLEAVYGEFLDPDDWEAAKFRQRADLLLRTQAGEEGAALAYRVLHPETEDEPDADEPTEALLKERRHRFAVIPAAVRLFLASGTAKGTRRARACLEEYEDLAPLLQQSSGSSVEINILSAYLAGAENKPYRVLQLLQPLTVTRLADNQLALVWKMLAGAFRVTEQTRREVHAWEEYRQILPADSSAVMQLVQALIRQGEWAKAMRAAELVDPLSGEEIELRLLRMQATVRFETTRSQPATNEALDGLEATMLELRKDRPRDVEVRQLQAVIAIYRERYDDAEKELKLAIEECDETLPAELQLARLHLRQARLDEAIAVCRNACELHPNQAQPLEALAQFLQRASRDDEARETLRAGLEALDDPRQKRSLSITLARFDFVYGDPADGIKRLRAMAAADVDDVRVRLLLLEVPKVRDAADGSGQKLIEELRTTEGENGLRWRLQQAALLFGTGWRTHTEEIGTLLAYCLNSDPGSPEAALMLGALHERLKDSAQAEKIYRRVLLLNPGASGVAGRLLDLLDRQERWVEAREVLEQLEPDDPAAASRRVRVLLGNRDFRAAISELELRVAGDPSDGDSRVLLARLLYSDRRDADAAFKLLDEAEPLDAKPLSVVTARVAILLAEKRVQEAETLLNDLVAREKRAEAYFLRARYYAGAQRHDEAEADYREVAKLAKGSGGYGLLGVYYSDNERPADAIAAWESGLASYPDDPMLERLLMKGLISRNEGGGDDRARADALLNKLTDRLGEGEEDPDLLAVRAGLLLGEASTAEDAAKAKDLLERVVTLQPNHRWASLSLIALAYKQNDFEAVRELAIRALGRNPNDADLMMARAEAEWRLNNPAMARRLSQMVLKDHSDNIGACNLLVSLALAPQSGETARLREALTVAEESLQDSPENEWLQIQRARLLARLDDTQQAASQLASFTEAHPDLCGVSTFLWLAGLHLSLGHR
ncbi:MAG: tetratricopeptide repeat protein, partial [Planctomycetes bacterium]|nr:tetratricopeptide repeat protein [Planctomycetota bacterium]